MSYDKLHKNVEKYLNKTGYTNWKVNVKDETKVFEYIVVIPAIKEFENLKILVNSLEQTDNKHHDTTLFVFVVNNIQSATSEIKEDNSNSIEWLNKLVGKSKLNLGVIDASTGENAMDDVDGGVGVARKIGMDAALSLFDYNSSNKLILGCLDADCTVQHNYINAVVEEYNSNIIKAGHVGYVHPMPENEEQKLAIICYEIFLRNYVLGLQLAKSPFAIHTIGSTMNCDVEHYIKIGGMNKRKAAEDFYFMEKLAKLTDIKYIRSTEIFPSGRGSFRVPFGTGQRVNRYLAKTHEEYKIYSLENFLVLAKWVKTFHNEAIKTSSEYLKEAESISVQLKDFLELNSFATQWDKIVKNSGSEKQIIRQKKIWFDGFRTLKLVHYLRDNGYPNKNMFPELNRMFEQTGNPVFELANTIPNILTQEKMLNQLREIT